MLPNNNQELDEQISALWKESEERLTKGKASGDAQYIDLTKAPIQLEALERLSEERAREAKAVFFESSGKTLALGVRDPKSEAVATVIEETEKAGYAVKLFVISEQSLTYALSFYRFITAASEDVSGRLDISPEKVATLEKELTSIKKTQEKLQQAFESRAETGDILSIVLAGAMTNKASDIHFESTDTGARLRYRIDGNLQTTVETIPGEIYRLILSRIKILSNLKLNVTTESQDGRFTIGLGEVEIEFRISIVPGDPFETIVMRILDPRSIEIEIDQLGFRPDDMEIITKELQEPNGMILNTGPTGSGKTTTLYTFLRTISTEENKVITIEDPVEYHLEGIEQTQADAEAGYTFAKGLEAMMRQDPDIILVGEIRDQATADTAIQAALTGHLVFSTLHTNSAPGVIPRLINLGVDRTSLAPAINLIIAQRLVRKVCEACRVSTTLDAAMKEKITAFLAELPERVQRPDLASVSIYEAPAEGGTCEACHGIGYKGRMGVFELMRVTKAIEPIIRENAGEGVVTDFAKKEGMVTLQEDAILRVLHGSTTFDEVVRVTGSLGGVFGK